MVVLVLNCGSSSLRFKLYEMEGEEVLLEGIVERIGAVSSLVTVQVAGRKRERHGINAPDHGAALNYVLQLLQTREELPVRSLKDIGAVGHRVVHGGERFAESVRIDEEVIEAIREAFDLAPLHNPANLKGILAAMKLLPDTPHVAVFDTAFHQTLPPEAYLYAIPTRLYRRHRIRKYGFHGTSHYYISRRLYKIADIPAEASKVITLHLGNGASATAIRNGESVDTSMGLTPLPGLVMGTRSGDIDPSVIFYLVEKEEMSLAEVHSLLNRYSGLLGMSGYAADMRDLLEEAERGDFRCQMAIEVFCYRARSYIGQYMAVLNGCDALVFSGGIGEHAPVIRRKICADLSSLGITLDETRNHEAVGREMKISTEDSPVQVWVIPTNEELVIARDAAKIAQTARQTPWV